MNHIGTGQIIAQARKEQGMTQKQLAERLHISDRTVSKWECGKGFPDAGILEPLADTLRIPLVDLIRGERGEASPDEEVRVREMIRILHHAWRTRMARIWKRAALVVAMVILAESVCFYLRTGGDGMRRWQFVQMFRENYELTCDQFLDRGVYRIEWISGDSRTVITQRAAIDRILTALQDLSAGEEYKDWGPGSIQGYLLITTGEGEPNDSTFVLSFPAFTISAAIGETAGRFFYYEASIDDVGAYEAVENIMDTLVREGEAERYTLGME